MTSFHPDRKGTTRLATLAQDFTTTTSDSAGGGVAIGAFVVIWLAIIVVMLIAQWKLFVKMGEEGWKGIIPIYSQYIIYTKANMPGWYVILLFIPCINYIALWFLADALGTMFGKSLGYKILLFLFAPIMYLVLAFGSSEYQGVQRPAY